MVSSTLLSVGKFPVLSQRHKISIWLVMCQQQSMLSRLSLTYPIFWWGSFDTSEVCGIQQIEYLYSVWYLIHLVYIVSHVVQSSVKIQLKIYIYVENGKKLYLNGLFICQRFSTSLFCLNRKIFYQNHFCTRNDFDKIFLYSDKTLKLKRVRK